MRQLWICPSRSRPGNVERLARAWALAESAHLLICLDDDDPTRDATSATVATVADPRIRVATGPRLRVCGTLNAAALQHAPNCDAIGFLGDDHVPRTRGFDNLLGEALTAQQGGLAYGNDLLQQQRLATAVLQDARLVTTLGQYAPRELTHLYLDNYWMSLGRAIGRLTYLPDVIIEHIHPVAQKAEWDDSYRQTNSTGQYAADAEAWAAYLAARFDDDVRAAMYA